METRNLRVSLLGGLYDDLFTWHIYQSYYLMGLRRVPGVQLSWASPTDRNLARICAQREWPRAARAAQRTWEFTTRLRASQRYPEATHVGRYLMHFPERTAPLRVAIDHYDARGIRDPRAYDWAELYFKVQRWPHLEYSAKVRPLVSGNGKLDEQRLARLIALRDSPKQLDLMLITKIWPGKRGGPTFWHPVEHLVRVFETVAGLKIRSVLRVIVPKLFKQEFPQRYIDRLSRCGVEITDDNVSADDLWTAMSTSRLVFLRPGRHMCVSWRMIDQLAMGACTLLDRAPYPEWPVPLQADREFIAGGCGVGPDEMLPDNTAYECLADTIKSLLADPERAAGVRRAAADYFDRHVAPERIARYLIETAEQFAKFHERRRASRAAMPPTATTADAYY